LEASSTTPCRCILPRISSFKPRYKAAAEAMSRRPTWDRRKARGSHRRTINGKQTQHAEAGERGGPKIPRDPTDYGLRRRPRGEAATILSSALAESIAAGCSKRPKITSADALADRFRSYPETCPRTERPARLGARECPGCRRANGKWRLQSGTAVLITNTRRTLCHVLFPLSAG
jgi:hypothetical protein